MPAGAKTEQVARELAITAKTADRHVRNADGKIGVSTGAAATLFAMEHGLWHGENSGWRISARRRSVGRLDVSRRVQPGGGPMYPYERSRARLAAAALTTLGLLSPMATSAAAAPPAKSERPVYRIADLFAGGPPPPVGSSTLSRTSSGLSARLHTTALRPGDAVTVWFVVFNEPAECTAGIPRVSRCGPKDGQAGRGNVSVLYAAGRFADEDGDARYGAHARLGDTSRALTGPGVVRPRRAEVILVLKTHGPWIPELGSEQLRTFAGGCADQSDAPPGAPPELVGQPGPNDCAEIQASVHQPAA